MKFAIEVLQMEKDRLVSEAKKGKSVEAGEFKELDNAIHWLERIQKEKLGQEKDYIVKQLKQRNCGYSSYHIMIDQESSNVLDWVEYEEEGERIELIAGDYLLIRH